MNSRSPVHLVDSWSYVLLVVISRNSLHVCSRKACNYFGAAQVLSSLVPPILLRKWQSHGSNITATQTLHFFSQECRQEEQHWAVRRRNCRGRIARWSVWVAVVSGCMTKQAFNFHGRYKWQVHICHVSWPHCLPMHPDKSDTVELSCLMPSMLRASRQDETSSVSC